MWVCVCAFLSLWIFYFFFYLDECSQMKTMFWIWTKFKPNKFCIFTRPSHKNALTNEKINGIYRNDVSAVRNAVYNWQVFGWLSHCEHSIWVIRTHAALFTSIRQWAVSERASDWACGKINDRSRWTSRVPGSISKDNKTIVLLKQLAWIFATVLPLLMLFSFYQWISGNNICLAFSVNGFWKYSNLFLLKSC